MIKQVRFVNAKIRYTADETLTCEVDMDMHQATAKHFSPRGHEPIPLLSSNFVVDH